MNNESNEKDPLRDIFASYRPTLSDSDLFDRTLEKRLRDVDMVRSYQRRERRAYPLALVITFVVGVVCGVAASMMTPKAATLALSLGALGGSDIGVATLPQVWLNWAFGATAALVSGVVAFRLATLRPLRRA